MNLKALLACTCATIVFTGCGDNNNNNTANTKLTPQSITEKDFSKIDLNKDGKITYDEFDLTTDNKGDLAGNAVYIQLDQNGDGVIAEEEFVAPAQPAPAVATPAKAPAKAEKKVVTKETTAPAKAAPAKTEKKAATPAKAETPTVKK